MRRGRLNVPESIAQRIFRLDPAIRYVAWAEPGRIIEMAQHPDHPSFNPSETDRMEELLLNPALLRMAELRGDLDLGGARWLVIRYGSLYQLVIRYGTGHASVGVELSGDPVAIAEKVCRELGLWAES